MLDADLQQEISDILSKKLGGMATGWLLVFTGFDSDGEKKLDLEIPDDMSIHEAAGLAHWAEILTAESVRRDWYNADEE